MTDYREGFKRLDYDAVLAFSDFVVANYKEYALLVDALGFQKALAVALQETGNLKMGDKPEGWLYNLCYFNMERIYSAAESLGNQYFSTCFALIRIVFESFPKLFYCMCNRVETIYILCCEEYDYQKVTKVQNDDINAFCRPYKNKISPEIRENFKKIVWFRNKIYDSSLTEIKELYDKYSFNIHPNFEPIYAKTKQDVKHGWSDSLVILNCFALLNLFILINLLSDQLKAMGKYDDAKQFVTIKIRQNQQTVKNFIQLLYPDKQEYYKNLPFALPLS